MAANYLYIAKTKRGEFDALAKTRRSHKDRLLPLFDLSRMGNSLKRFKSQADVPRAFIDETVMEIAQVWAGRKALIDSMRWPVNATLKSGEHVLSYFYHRLTEFGVIATPVLGYDRWDGDQYREAIQKLELPANCPVCLRLDSEAINDSAEPEYFRGRALQILEDMQVPPHECLVLIDFEDLAALPLEESIERGHRVMVALVNVGFKQFATAGCSLPPSIDMAVGTTDSAARVTRREWILWRTLRAAYPQFSWMYGDYGVRGPRSVDDIIAPHTNGKIRYTIDGEYYVARGHSLQLGNKGAQMHDLSDAIINSGYFMEAGFSWGDGEIVRCSQQEFRGNSSRWIAIDTNHHVAWVVQEIAEFLMKAKQAKV